MTEVMMYLLLNYQEKVVFGLLWNNDLYMLSRSIKDLSLQMAKQQIFFLSVAFLIRN